MKAWQMLTSLISSSSIIFARIALNTNLTAPSNQEWIFFIGVFVSLTLSPRKSVATDLDCMCLLHTCTPNT